LVAALHACRPAAGRCAHVVRGGPRRPDRRRHPLPLVDDGHGARALMASEAPRAGRLVRWFDDRLRASHFARTALNKVFPDNWSFMLGEIALYAFVTLVLTGIYLAFFFVPSAKEVVYHGHYAPLRGVSMSEAYRSAVRLSFDV